MFDMMQIRNIHENRNFVNGGTGNGQAVRPSLMSFIIIFLISLSNLIADGQLGCTSNFSGPS